MELISAGKILILAPHTDDGELGCGAAIAQYAGKSELHYAAFSLCRESLPEGLPPDSLQTECLEATSVLGIQNSNVHFFDHQVRTFPAHRQLILEEMIALRDKIKPELVFMPAHSDIHQDHQVIHMEAMRAFKHLSILGYELPWNNFSFRPQYFIPATADSLDKKIHALQAYRSQAHRIYMKEEFTRSLATVRGVQCGQPLAEAFEVYRLIG
jgi:LmbE family N-acetylglucosaminyl deacetylase